MAANETLIACISGHKQVQRCRLTSDTMTRSAPRDRHIGSDLSDAEPHGASRLQVEKFDDRAYFWLISQALLLEYEDVLLRPEQMHAHGVASEDVHDLIASIAARAVRVYFDFRIRPQLRDPNDELVTGNRGQRLC